VGEAGAAQVDWYGWDEDGAGVHDVIGTRCDPNTNLLLPPIGEIEAF
jgi:uncharacterized protein YcgI (DUF1989 family)